jgi:hypothetical protein
MQKRWFHGTTIECWKKIQQDGFLKPNEDKELFLARNRDELERMINLPIFTDLRKSQLILSVRYTPDNINDDYNPKNWEMIVRKSIPLSYIKVLTHLKSK